MPLALRTLRRPPPRSRSIPPGRRRATTAATAWACIIAVGVLAGGLATGWPARPCAAGGGPRRERADEDPSTRASLRLASLLRHRSPAREQTIRFTHTAWNASADELRDIEIGIAVPASDFRQSVLEVDFDPAPRSIEGDPWRQRTARFRIGRLGAGESIEIHVRVRVLLRDAEWRITGRDVGQFDQIPATILRQYLRDGKRYGLRDPRVIAAAEAVRVDEGGPLEQVRRIHDYVADRLDYERDHRWDTAGAVLERGRGSCSEYCYLMIALCRFHGIPARYAGGTWLGHDRPGGEPTGLDRPGRAGPGSAVGWHVDRVFHRWVEVYLPRIGWFPVDPTENDRSAASGNHYRFFGRIPWSRLTMFRGDGDLPASALLGWDYRSGMRWEMPRRLSSGSVYVDRVAVWLPAASSGDGGRVAHALTSSPPASAHEG